MKYLHVASRVFNTPLFLTADKAEVIASVVLARVRGDETVELEQTEEKPRVLYAAVGTGVAQTIFAGTSRPFRVEPIEVEHVFDMPD